MKCHSGFHIQTPSLIHKHLDSNKRGNIYANLLKFPLVPTDSHIGSAPSCGQVEGRRNRPCTKNVMPIVSNRAGLSRQNEWLYRWYHFLMSHSVIHCHHHVFSISIRTYVLAFRGHVGAYGCFAYPPSTRADRNSS